MLPRYSPKHMEWMLQVIDELDDVIGSLRLCWVGARRGVVLTLCGIAGAATLSALVVIGTGAFLVCSASVLTSAFLAFWMQRRFARPLLR